MAERRDASDGPQQTSVVDEHLVVVERVYDVSGHYPPDLPGCAAVHRGPGLTGAH